MEITKHPEEVNVDSAALSNLIEHLFGKNNEQTTVTIPIYSKTNCTICDNYITLNMFANIQTKVNVPKSLLKPFILYKECKSIPDFNLIWAPLHWQNNPPLIFCTRKHIQHTIYSTHLEDSLKHLACTYQHNIL